MQNKSVYISVLETFEKRIGGLAKECNFDVNCIGRLLKFTPKGVPTHVMLELEPCFHESTKPLSRPHNDRLKLYRHRSLELTSEHRGKTVSIAWIENFLRENAEKAKRIVEKYDADLVEQETIFKQPLSRPSIGLTLEDQKTHGYHHGNSLCPVCYGNASEAGHCYKCGGSGWV